MNKKILITGCSGFIGFHVTLSLLKDKYEVLGIDNMNNYYDLSLKKSRLKKLLTYKKFSFEKINIADTENFKNIFTTFKPRKVVHLAAQAGVRYSIENPYIYLESNLLGFLNIMEFSRKNKVEGVIYASSSSIYGANKKIPYNISDKTDHPISFYGATKKSNELIAFVYSNLYNLHVTGLRYFTVYGPWGRPDMAYYIFTDNIIKGNPITVFNEGNMKRDFTYIDDIVSGTKAAIHANYKNKIFNLGNRKSENIMDIITIIENKLHKKADINFAPVQPGDVIETFADIQDSYEMLNYNPTINIDEGIPKFIDWYLNYNQNKKY